MHLLYGTRLRALSLLTAVTLTAGFALAFFYAPMDADQGFMQKIFYVHVPLAIVALCGFVFGGIMAIQHLRTRESRYDLRSYVAIHLSLVLGAGVLITGSIWAKATTPLFAADGGDVGARWLLMLGLYDLVFGLLAYAVFDFLVED